PAAGRPIAGHVSRLILAVLGGGGLVGVASFWTGWVPGGVAGVIAGLSFGLLGVLSGLYANANHIRREEEAADIEFAHLRRAFMTMAFALGYALLETLAGAPRLYHWVVYSVGMLTWALASTVLMRRAS